MNVHASRKLTTYSSGSPTILLSIELACKFYCCFNTQGTIEKTECLEIPCLFR